MYSQTRDEIVRTADLWKIYRTGPIEYVALKGITVSISRGELVSALSEAITFYAIRLGLELGLILKNL